MLKMCNGRNVAEHVGVAVGRGIRDGEHFQLAVDGCGSIRTPFAWLRQSRRDWPERIHEEGAIGPRAKVDGGSNGTRGIGVGSGHETSGGSEGAGALVGSTILRRDLLLWGFAMPSLSRSDSNCA